MESKKIKMVLSTVYGTMAASPSTCQDVNSIGFCPSITNDTPAFVYADTDAIHCDRTPDQIKDIIERNRPLLIWLRECMK